MGTFSRRRLGLLLAGAVLLAGCAGNSTGGRPSTDSPTTALATRPFPGSQSVAPPQATPVPTPVVTVGGPTGETQEALVTSVADGDTIRVSIGTREYRVRYIGIDAPELDREGQPAESFARESFAANRDLVKGETVTLEKDVSETDQFGRLLRYVWIQDGDTWLMVNAELVRLGFAHAATYPPDVKYADLLRRAEQEARDGSAGLWADSSLVVNPIAQPIPTRRAPQPPSKDCDPSYPDVCIPPAPPDLDCGGVPYDSIRVTGRDPHGFDGNGDGIGCEP